MGKHQKRQLVAKRLKALGAPRKLYSGSKFAAYKLLNSYINELEWKTQFKPGDVINDCDFANYRVEKPIFTRMRLKDWGRGRFKKSRFRRGHIIELAQFALHTGRLSCGCPTGPDLPLSQGEIEKQILDYYQDHKPTSKVAKLRFSVLAAGGHITDQDGCILPEFKNNYEG